MLVYLLTTPKDEARFWSHVTKGDGCWEWTGLVAAGTGYGRFSWLGRYELAHRVSYRLNIGYITPGFVVMHSCDNRLCVRPSHLSLGTHALNSADAVSRGRMAGGERHWNAKLTVLVVRRMRVLRGLGLPYKEIGRMFKVRPSAAWRAITGKGWKQVKEPACPS